MNYIAYILFILQIVSLYTTVANDRWGIFHVLSIYFFSGIPGFMYFLGQMLPTILGIILLVIHGKRKRKKNMVTDKDLEKNPTLEYWTCSNCGTRNRMKVSSCQKCDYSKVWSDEHSKN